MLGQPRAEVHTLSDTDTYDRNTIDLHIACFVARALQVGLLITMPMLTSRLSIVIPRRARVRDALQWLEAGPRGCYIALHASTLHQTIGALTKSDPGEVLTEQAQDSEHIRPLLEDLAMYCMNTREYMLKHVNLLRRTGSCVRHDIEIITQLLYPLHKLCTGSI